MKKIITSIFLSFFSFALVIPGVHARCMDMGQAVDGELLCCHDSPDGASCGGHEPIDTSNREILSETFVSHEEIDSPRMDGFLFGDTGEIIEQDIFSLSFSSTPLYVSHGEELQEYVKQIRKLE